MAIIRNDRRAREAAAEREAAEQEEQVDYSWHPSDEELPDPISADSWLAMLDDPAVFDEDGLHAVECVDDYGGPVTFQQLSVRYRGTMGRYRRWLNGVAERAAIHEGREPFGTDDAGNLQWWPYLYRQRITGKAAANVHEMVLRPELSEALRRRAAALRNKRKDEEQAQALSAARRRSEERRARLEAAARAQSGREEGERTSGASATQAAAAPSTAVRQAADADARPRGNAAVAPPQATQATRQGKVLEPPEAPLAVSGTASSPQGPQGGKTGDFEAMGRFLETMASLGGGVPTTPTSAAAGRPKAGASTRKAPRPRLDFARTYSDRIYDALDLMREGMPGLTVAQVAREVGDESVECLQGYLNGDAIPGFAYLARLCDALFLDGRRLEAADSLAAGLPVFCTYRERYGSSVDALSRRPVREVVYVTDDSPERRCGAILRMSDVGYVLLDRQAVLADADRTGDSALSAYIRMVREADELARDTELTTRSVRLSAADWDALVSGRLWPGTPCLAG